VCRADTCSDSDTVRSVLLARGGAAIAAAIGTRPATRSHTPLERKLGRRCNAGPAILTPKPLQPL
jgi:hypothetical protein